MDGEDIVAKLKEFGLGIEVRQRIVEEITVEAVYFENL
jgi:hypothetical protein